MTTSLTGDHYFDIAESINGALLTWRWVNGSGEREAPDTRTYTYAANNSGQDEIVTPSRQAAGDLREVFQAPDRNFSLLEDEIDELGFDVEVPVTMGLEAEVTYKVGWSEYKRVRDSADRLFRFDLTSSAPDYLALMTPSQLFAESNWGAGYLDVRILDLVNMQGKEKMELIASAQ